MSKIEIRSQDLFVKTITDKDGIEREVINFRSALAFDEDFIEEMKEKGVKTFVEEGTDNDEDEETEEKEEE